MPPEVTVAVLRLKSRRREKQCLLQQAFARQRLHFPSDTFGLVKRNDDRARFSHVLDDGLPPIFALIKVTRRPEILGLVARIADGDDGPIIRELEQQNIFKRPAPKYLVRNIPWTVLDARLLLGHEPGKIVPCAKSQACHEPSKRFKPCCQNKQPI